MRHPTSNPKADKSNYGQRTNKLFHAGNIRQNLLQFNI